MIYPETRHVLMRCPEWVVVTGDHVGCGIDFDDHTIFFTKNGVLTGKSGPLHCSFLIYNTIQEQQRLLTLVSQGL